MFRIDSPDRHRAHGCDERGPGLRAMQHRPGDQAELRPGGSEPHRGIAPVEPAPKGPQGRRRVAPGSEPVLIRTYRARGQTRLPPHRRPARGPGPRPGPSRVPERGHRARHLPRHAGEADPRSPGPGRRRALALRRQPERPHHVHRSTPARHRARAPLAGSIHRNARQALPGTERVTPPFHTEAYSGCVLPADGGPYGPPARRAAAPGASP